MSDERSEKPPEQRPERTEFWEQRFRAGKMPWDAGRAPQALQDFAAHYAAPYLEAAATQALRVPRVLIPGCGSAWDAAFLDRCGWKVCALDFSPAAVDLARTVVGTDWRGELLCADFFSFPCAQQFDVIYERAFLCALPRKLWPEYAPRMAALLPAGGLLAGYFYFCDEPKGPPFGILPQQLTGMLAPHFHLLSDDPVHDSQPVFAGKERWQVWQRTASCSPTRR